MPDLNIIGHLVSVLLIAVLIKQYMQLRFQFHDFKREQKTDVTDLADETQITYVKGEGTLSGEIAYEEETPHIRIRVKHKQLTKELESSGWCFGTTENDRFCRFSNLCYNSKEKDYLVFHGTKSVFESVSREDGVMVVPLSSLKTHNTQRRRLVEVPSHSVTDFKIHWIDQKSLLFRRFKPDNLMHILHDDIIPLYQTLRLITMTTATNQSEAFDVQLVYDDGWDAVEFSQLYRMLSSHEQVFPEDLDEFKDLVCFSDIYVGVTSSSVWYQYGFTEPQGPIKDQKASGEVIRSVADFIVHYLPQIDKSNDKELPVISDYLVLLTRQGNRKILNEVDLVRSLVVTLRIKILTLSFEYFSLSYLINAVRGSKGIIGMHGSLLALSVFLKPDSIVIELFPYAVNPDSYTPYATLANLPNMGLVYRAWANQNQDNSIGHPDWPADVGGLGHLTEEERTEILQQTEVPPHLCCSDPSWLYHIYQDTIVDIDMVTSLVQSALQESKTMAISEHLRDVKIQPATVSNVSCRLLKKGSLYHLILHWNRPWNVKYLQYDKITYYVLLQGRTVPEVKTFQASQTSLLVKDIVADVYHVWVKCELNTHLSSSYSDSVQCMTENE